MALHVREQLECIELCLGVDEERVKSLWVSIKGQTHMGDIAVGVHYKPPDKEDVLVWLQPATKAPHGHPSPRRGVEENGKKQAETGGSG